MIEFTQEAFSESGFARPQTVMHNLVQVISRASMVSVFEKPKFKAFANTLTPIESELYAHSLYQRLYGDEQAGFEGMLDLLKTYKMAKWTVISIVPLYFKPMDEVFIKPTTVKGIIKNLELKDLEYQPTPSWGFYALFRDVIEEMKTKVDPCLSPNNAAFTGFLMMTLGN